ncbi:unnamed protein product [Prunus armeniaca]|uniref:Uncharacterized protein n=1 Tax=Prunus armeniaca TaxID=36596 RepID=A0A6J5W398_PRUAR|nr:unnamed protein product [Prunus armeniaca]
MTMTNLTSNYASSIEYDQLHQEQAITIKNTSLKRAYSNDKDKPWVAAPNKKKKKAINPNFNHDNLDDDLNGHLDNNCNDNEDDDNDLNDDDS